MLCCRTRCHSCTRSACHSCTLSCVYLALPFSRARSRAHARCACAQDTSIAALQLLLQRVQEKDAPAEGDEAAAGTFERLVPKRGTTLWLCDDDGNAVRHEENAATDADGAPITSVEFALEFLELAAAAGLPCRALGEEQRVVREAEVLGAVREAIPGELGRRAASEFTKAITKFSRAEDGAPLLASADALAPHAGPSILVLRPVRSTCVSVAQVC